MSKIQAMIDARFAKHEQQKQQLQVQQLSMLQNKMNSQKDFSRLQEQQLVEKDNQIAELRSQLIESMNNQNSVTEMCIEQQRVVIEQQQQLNKYQQSLSKSERMLERAINIQHISDFTDNYEVYTLLCDIGNIGMDNNFDIKQYFKSKAEAKGFYNQIKLLLRQNRENPGKMKQGQLYTNFELKIALLQFITLKSQGYNLQKQISEKSNNVMPSKRTLQRFNNTCCETYKISKDNIGLVFKEEILEQAIPQWRKQNKIPEDEEVIVNMSQDAMSLTAKVIEIDGVLHNCIQEADGRKLPISSVFVYIISAEKEYSFLPVFSQFSSSGQTTMDQITTWFAIREALKKYKITTKLFPHDGDQFFCHFDAFTLDVVKSNFVDNLIRNPYKLLDNPEKVQTLVKEQFRELISMPDSKHLLKLMRNLLNTQLLLSLSNKIDGQYFCAQQIQKILYFLPKDCFNPGSKLKMSDILSLQLYGSKSTTTLMQAAKLNTENSENDNFKLSLQKASVFWMMLFPLVSMDTQMTSASLQRIFTVVTFVMIKQHIYGQDCEDYSKGDDRISHQNQTDGSANLRMAFNTEYLEHYIVYLTTMMKEFTDKHSYRMICYSSHPNELHFAKIRLNSNFNSTPDKFREVSTRLQLQLCLADELGFTISTKRIGTQHTNRISIDKQLDDNEIKDLVNLADVIFKFMNGNEVDTKAFDQIFDFWFTIKDGISKEWGSKKLINQAKIIVDGHNNERAEKISRIIYSASTKEIISECAAEFVKPPKVIEGKQSKKKQTQMPTE
ncbi:Conserved_hypothetical protein [Hexamita inflata]|uniref:Uncharacterized protein n=1 Tax=Hexamita inflata TaxID=28002 RepID=A0AA86UJG8_9EUKA|nr:Conserved hypothetical protein [Hexamita inflata]